MRILRIVIVALIFSTALFAQKGGRAASSRSITRSTKSGISTYRSTVSGGSVHVRGYYRKDGTYVQPHVRTAPDGNPLNNFSFPGNYNPYTGKMAAGDPVTYLRNYYNRSTTSTTFLFSNDAPDVSALQLGLGSLGFSPGVISGQYNESTRSSVKAFQTEAGLPSDGIVNLATLSALVDELEAFRDSQLATNLTNLNELDFSFVTLQNEPLLPVKNSSDAG